MLIGTFLSFLDELSCLILSSHKAGWSNKLYAKNLPHIYNTTNKLKVYLALYTEIEPCINVGHFESIKSLFMTGEMLF